MRIQMHWKTNFNDSKRENELKINNGIFRSLKIMLKEMEMIIM